MAFLRSMALGAVIDVQTGGSVAALGKVSSAFNTASQSAASMAVGGLRTLSTGFGMASIAAGGLATALLGTGAAGLKLAGDFQGTRIAFETMLGSAEKADAFLKELRAFAMSTPFEFNDLTAASRKMFALGFSSEEVLPLLSKVGDAVAAMSGGAPEMDSVIRALGQMKAKGKATAEEMNQLLETGTFGWENLAKHMGKTVPQAMEAVSDRTVSAQTVIDAFAAHSAERFGGLMEKQSKTFLGQISNLKDAATQTMVTAFTPMLEPMSELVAMIGEMSASMETATQFGQGMADALTFILNQVKALKAEFGGVVLDFIGGMESSGEMAYELGFAAVAVTAIAVAAVPILAILAAAAGAAALLGEFLIPVAAIITGGLLLAVGVLGAAFLTAEGSGRSMFEVLTSWWETASTAFGFFTHGIQDVMSHLGGLGYAFDLLKLAWIDVTAAFGLGSGISSSSINSLAATMGNLIGVILEIGVAVATIGAVFVGLSAFMFRHVGRPISKVAFQIVSAFVTVQTVILQMIAELVSGLLNNPVTRFALEQVGVDLTAAATPVAPTVPTITEEPGESPLIDILDAVSEQQSAVVAPDVPPLPKQEIKQTINTSVQVDGKEIAKATKKAEVELTERAGFSITPWQKRQILERGATVLPPQ